MRELIKTTWNFGHRMSGVQLSWTDAGEYAVHWINGEGNTVCGDYYKELYLARQNYMERVNHGINKIYKTEAAK